MAASKMKSAFRAFLLTTTICGFPGFAQADPVSLTAIIGSAAGGAFASSAAVTAVLGSTLATVLGAVITAGIGFLGQELFGQTSQQSGSRTREFNPHPNFRFAFGEFRQEGSVIFHHVVRKTYYMVILLNSIPSEEISKVIIQEHHDLDVAGSIGADLYDMTATGNWPTNDIIWDNGIFEIWVGRGDHTQAPQKWLDEIGPSGSEDPGILKATDTWSGLTVAFVTIKSNKAKWDAKRFAYGKPPPLAFEGKWSKVYDPRQDSTSGVTGAAGAQRPDDATTWEYSSNPALCGLTLAIHEYGLGFDQEMIPIQQWADAADAWDNDWATVSTVDEVVFGSGAVTENEYDPSYDGTLGGTLQRTSATATNIWLHPVGSGITTTIADVGDLPDGSLSAGGSLDDYYLKLGGGNVSIRYGGGVFFVDLTQLVGSNYSIEAKLTCEIGRSGAGGLQVHSGRAAIITGTIDSMDTGGDQAEAQVDTDTAGATDWQSLDTGFVTITNGQEAVGVLFSGTNNHAIRNARLTLRGDFTGTPLVWGCNGMVVIEQREVSLLDPVLACFAGHIDTTDGLLGVRAGTWEAPTDTLSQPVSDEIEILGVRDAGFDGVQAKFIWPNSDWQETDGPGYYLRNAARVHPLDLPLVSPREQAARLEKIFALRAEPNRTVTAGWDGREMNRRIGERVNFALDGFGRAAGTYEITGKSVVTQPVEDGFEVGVRMTLREDVEDTWTWGAADYTHIDALPVIAPTETDFAAPTVTAAQSDYNSGSAAVARVKITATITSDVAASADTIAFEIDDGSGYAGLPSQTAETGKTTYVAYLDPATFGVTYTARARAVSTDLGVTDWAYSASVTIVAPELDYATADYSPEYT